jgi:hypothetical protein
MMRFPRGLDEDARMDALYTATAAARGGFLLATERDVRPRVLD